MTEQKLKILVYIKVDYKKAMLIFYEQSNLSCLKEIFIEQFECAVNAYF
jgi:hypothetical protein